MFFFCFFDFFCFFGETRKVKERSSSLSFFSLVTTAFPYPYASCVLEGPGTHCASANSSANTEVDSHFRLLFSVKRRMNWATCAEGPPKAVQPSSAKSRASCG